MKANKIFLFCFIFISSLEAKYEEFNIFQETLSKKQVQEKIEKYLAHDSSIQDFYKITDQSFILYKSKDNKIKNNPEFILKFGNKPKPTRKKFIPNFDSDKPFKGFRVAIDPGHLGGDMAALEDRYMDMVLPNKQKTHIQFNEGLLTVETAKVLSDYLKLYGTDVFLTKTEAGQSVFELTFSEWCSKNFNIKTETDWYKLDIQKKIFEYLSKTANQQELKHRLENISNEINEKNKILLIKQVLFRLGYNIFDLIARAKKINNFNPDITIVIHYNAEGADKNILSSNNYNLTFIPGSFLKENFIEETSIYEFLRLVLTDDIERSFDLSKNITKHMEQILEEPLKKDPNYQKYTNIYISPGIYARNLFLTRLVHSPICYGETLIQNNLKEALLLNLPNSPRINQVALAYFKGICDYLIDLD